MSDRTTAAETLAAGAPAKSTPHVDAGDAGYSKDLKSRHINMIAIGGAIGTGLFLGAGGRLASAGPSLAIAYAVCGVFAFFVVRALGELVLYRPSSGAFVSYAREFMGEKGAFAAGWLYFLNWSTTAIADITAAATYAHFWAHVQRHPAVGPRADRPRRRPHRQPHLGEVLRRDGVLVRDHQGRRAGRLHAGRHLPGGHPAPGRRPHPRPRPPITDNGGIFPTGMLPMLLVIQGVVFAYASVELCGVAAGETENPEKIMPKAINSIMWRVGLFYVGSVVLLALLLPYTAYSGDQSPFVTVMDKLGVPGAAGVMNLVVLTAALSSLNSGLYSTGRILRSMALSGSAPKFTGRMNKGQVPYGGILLTAGFGVLGVGLNYVVPGQAFEIVLNFASIGILGTWGMIMLCSLLFWHRAAGRPGHPPLATGCPGPRTPRSSRWSSSPRVPGPDVVRTAASGRTTVMCLPLIAAALVGGWFVVRGRVGRDRGGAPGRRDRRSPRGLNDGYGRSAAAAGPLRQPQPALEAVRLSRHRIGELQHLREELKRPGVVVGRRLPDDRIDRVVQERQPEAVHVDPQLMGAAGGRQQPVPAEPAPVLEQLDPALAVRLARLLAGGHHPALLHDPAAYGHGQRERRVVRRHRLVLLAHPPVPEQRLVRAPVPGPYDEERQPRGQPVEPVRGLQLRAARDRGAAGPAPSR